MFFARLAVLAWATERLSLILQVQHLFVHEMVAHLQLFNAFTQSLYVCV